MALIDKASLLMVPSVYEDGTLYNVLPSGNKAPDETGNHNGYDQTRADFTFSRGFNLTATRVNADGLIEKGRENLVTYSNDFTNASWSKNSIQSVTGGHSGYDGSNDAGLIVPNTTASAHQISKNTETFTGLQTYSIYAKNGGYDLQLRATGIGSTNIWVSFDLTNGVVGTSGGGQIDSSITSIGNGWYRCSMTFNTASPPYIGLYQVPNGATSGQAEVFEGDGTSGLYVQDAQVERSLVPTDYIETGSTTATAGVLENTPRIDYSSGAGSLKLEPQRTNLVTNSEYHSGTTYGNNDVTTTDNEATSPEGVQNAAKIVLDSGTNTSNGGHYYSLNSTAGTTYTISVFAKAGEYRYFTFTYGSSTAVGGHFDLQEGVKLGDITNSSYTNTSSSIEDYGNNWYRLIVTLTDTNGAPARFLSMKPSPSASVPSNNNYSSTGDGTSGAYIYGFQLEAASHASSYIPTYGSAATRGADSCSVTGVSDVMPTSYPFTLYAEMDVKAIGDEWGISFLNNAVNNNYFVIGVNFQNKYGMISRPSGSSSYIYSTDDATEGTHKICGVFTSSELKLYVDGVLIDTETNAQSFNSAVDDILIGTLRSVGDTGIRNDVRQAMIFDEALTDAECVTLTTL